MTAGPDIEIVSAWQYQVGLPANIMYSTAPATYQPGQRVDQDWLGAPLSPGTFDSEPPGLGDQASRFDDTMFYSVAGMTDSAGHFTSIMAGTHVSSRLYLGDQTLVDADNFLRGNARDLPAEDGTYRLEADTDHVVDQRVRVATGHRERLGRQRIGPDHRPGVQVARPVPVRSSNRGRGVAAPVAVPVPTGPPPASGRQGSASSKTIS